jgi:hypothetical protein
MPKSMRPVVKNENRLGGDKRERGCQMKRALGARCGVVVWARQEKLRGM